MERIAICGGRLLTPQGILEQHILLAEDGVITAIIPEITPISTDYRRVDAKGQYVSPGFVDIHQHGAGGSDYMEPDADTYYTVLSTHLKYGTTSVMPTLMSASAEHTIRAARQYVRALADPRISCNLLGLHVEGLYISPEQAGAQNQKQIKAFDPAEYHAICEAAEGHLRRWSVAPELPGADEFARFARDNRITLSIAHSDADLIQSAGRLRSATGISRISIPDAAASSEKTASGSQAWSRLPIIWMIWTSRSSQTAAICRCRS